MEQHTYEVALGGGRFNLLHSDVWSLVKGKLPSLRQWGADLYRSPHHWSVVMQIRTPNPHSLIGPKGTVLIGQNVVALINW